MALEADPNSKAPTNKEIVARESPRPIAIKTTNQFLLASLTHNA
jgi:hypothetical protein